jgi:YVTN family beta-propeller protein
MTAGAFANLACPVQSLYKKNFLLFLGGEIVKKKTLRKKLAIAALAACILGTGSAYAAFKMVAGPQTDGTAYTPSGWRVTPVGVQKPAGFYPANAVLSPDGQALLVPDIVGNHNGRQAVQVLDAKEGSLIQDLELTASDEGVAPGLAFSHDGKHVYLATANKNTVVVFGWDSGAKKLTIQQKLTMPNNTFPQNVAVAPDDKTVYVTGQYTNTLVAVDVATGNTSTASAGSYPYGLALSADGSTAYVSNQGENTLSVFSIDGRTINPLSKITVGTHPNAVLPDAKRNRVFVANGDSDTLSVVDTVKNTVSNTISLAPYAAAPCTLPTPATML